MVRLAVLAYEPGPVHSEDDVQVQQRNVMYQHVEAALQETGVHAGHGQHALLGHAGRHGDGVALGYAGVEKPLRKAPGEPGKARALGHRGRERGDALIPLRLAAERLQHRVVRLDEAAGVAVHPGRRDTWVEHLHTLPFWIFQY